MPDQSLHSTALCRAVPLLACPAVRETRLGKPGTVGSRSWHPATLPPHRPVLRLRLSLVLTITSAWSLAQQPLAQQPYPYYPGGPAPDAPGTAPQYPTRACSVHGARGAVEHSRSEPQQLSDRDRPSHPRDGRLSELASPGGQPWTGDSPDRLAQIPAGPEVIRPAIPTVPGEPRRAGACGSPAGLPSRPAHCFKASHRRSTRRNSVCRRWGFRRDWAPPSPRRRSRDSTGNSSSAKSLRRTRSRWSSAGPRSSSCERSLAASTSPTKTWPVFRSSPTRNLPSSARRRAGPC